MVFVVLWMVLWVSVMLLQCCSAQEGVNDGVQRQELTHCLSKTIKLLNGAGIRYFLFYGTLKDILMSGEVGSYNSDADVVVMRESLPILHKTLSKRKDARIMNNHLSRIFPHQSRTSSGYSDIYTASIVSAYNTSSNTTHNTHNSHTNLSGVMVEIFPCLVYPYDMIFPLQRVEVKGFEATVPQDVPGFLRFHYGSAFKIHPRGKGLRCKRPPKPNS